MQLFCFSLHKGAFVNALALRHNVTANLLMEVYHDVRTEPYLQQSLTSEVMGNQSANTPMDGMDVRVFNPRAQSNQLLQQQYQKPKREKCAYEQHIKELKHSSVDHLVFSVMGRLGFAAFYKKLPSRLAEKKHSTLSWVRCLLSWSLLRSAIQCIRGAYSSCGQPISSCPPLNLIASEALLY